MSLCYKTPKERKREVSQSCRLMCQRQYSYLLLIGLKSPFFTDFYNIEFFYCLQLTGVRLRTSQQLPRLG